MTVFGAGVNALDYDGTNYAFSKSVCGDAEVEWKEHDLAEEKLQSKKDKWNEDRMKRLDVINKSRRQNNKARAYINNADEAMVEYYRVFAKRIKHLPSKP